DRRILLQQDALCQGLAPKPGNIYQMEVARVTDTGYLLKQNDVELMLPFNKAAAFEINVFNERYLQPGDLVAVQVEADGTTQTGRVQCRRLSTNCDRAPTRCCSFPYITIAPMAFS
ncbi:MAG: hypothetical protein K2F71_08320, partial [Paramuribaculum sp.]|nr:hypothetical protein [Paramuribaculum sp.]